MSHARILLSHSSLNQPPAMTQRYRAALALSHSGISTSNSRGDVLLLEQDMPVRKEAAARTLIPPTEVLQRVPTGSDVEGGAGTRVG